MTDCEREVQDPMIEEVDAVEPYVLAMDLVREVGIKEFIEKNERGEGWKQLLRIFRALDARAAKLMQNITTL